jgi:hypothetical protein
MSIFKKEDELKVEETLLSLNRKGKERDKLLDRLSRFVAWEKKWGFSPHEISKILLKPNGEREISTNRDGYLEAKYEYDSIVTLKDGREFFFAGMNVKEILEGGE